MIPRWLKNLFKKQERIIHQMPPEPNGEAFSYKTHTLAHKRHLCPGDQLHATIHDEHGTETVVSEITDTVEVDTVAMFRFKDALGMEHGIGAAFGKAKSQGE